MLTLSLFGFSRNEVTGEYSLVEVRTPSQEVYDDGIERKLFNSFSILNEAGEVLLRIGEVYDKPVKIILSAGSYKILFKGIKGELKENTFTVDKAKFIVINL